MANNQHHIELKSISCKSVKCFVPFQKPSLSISISVAKSNESPRHHVQDPQRTPIDKENGENPEWDQPMRFEFSQDVDSLVLFFEIKHHGGLLGTNVVGRVRVPIAELAAEQMPGMFHFVSYQVKSQDDKPNGVLTFGYKMKDAESPRVSSDTIYKPNDTVSYLYAPEFPHPSHINPIYPPSDAMSYLRPPEFPQPWQNNSVYPPMSETHSINPRPPNSLYPALDDARPNNNSMYPQLQMEPLYPPLTEVYRPSSGPAFYDYPGTAPRWGNYGLGPAEGHNGHYAPQGNCCAYPEPVDTVGYRRDLWNGRTII